MTDPEVLDLINNCIGAESERWGFGLQICMNGMLINNVFRKRLSAKEIIEHPFLAVEPEVILLVSEKTHLTMQVVFKGMDKLSVKFEFNSIYFFL